MCKLTETEYEEVVIGPAEREDYVKTKNPAGLLPFFETEEGGLSESSTIVRYLCNSKPDVGLYGLTVHEQSYVDEILDKHACAVNSFMWQVVLAVTGHVPLPGDKLKELNKKLKDYLRDLDTLVKDKEYVVLDKLTIADLYLLCTLSVLMGIFIDAGFRKAIPNLTTYFEKRRDDEVINSVLGKQRYLGKPLKTKSS